MSAQQNDLFKTYRDFKDNKITAIYADSSVKNFDIPARVSDIVTHPSFSETKVPIVGAYVNNELKGLNEEIFVNVKEIVPVYLNSREGMIIYENSLRLLFSSASKLRFPNRQLSSFHLLDGGIYFEYLDKDAVKDEDCLALEEKMNEIVKAAVPIHVRDVSWSEAYDYFLKINHKQTASLLERRADKTNVRIVICNDFVELFQHNTPHVSNTTLLSHFSVSKYVCSSPPTSVVTKPDTPTTVYGIILRFPTAADPTVVKELPERPIPLIYQAYQQAEQYRRIVDVHCVSDMNRLIANSVDKKLSTIQRQALNQYALVIEGSQDRQLVTLSTAIASRPAVRVVCIAGPSSSGKTTFAHRLSVHLRVLGKLPSVISLDDFYLDRDLMPRDSKGVIDFEAPEALDLPLVNRTLVDLIAGKEVVMPAFDMITGKQGKGGTRKLTDNSVIVLESIHGLNDKITEMVPPENKFRIFIAPFTPVSIDEDHRIVSSDVRLLRRLVRDYQFRGYSAEDTIKRWPLVRAGEELHVLPTQKGANLIFNSSMEYELHAIKTIAQPLLRNIAPSSAAYSEAQRLLYVLADMLTLNHSYVPPASILREFIGNSPFYQE